LNLARLLFNSRPIAYSDPGFIDPARRRSSTIAKKAKMSTYNPNRINKIKERTNRIQKEITQLLGLKSGRAVIRQIKQARGIKEDQATWYSEQIRVESRLALLKQQLSIVNEQLTIEDLRANNF
tara:strand:- start:91674 stop:92045 length:372 start_codon:yes stop_codon:yes gene_type:complete